MRGLDVGVRERRDERQRPLARLGEAARPQRSARGSRAAIVPEPVQSVWRARVSAAARRHTSTTSRTDAVRHEMRESSGRTTSSKRPDSSCSSSVTSAWKRRPFLSTSTMSPAPIPLEVARGAAGGAASGGDVDQGRLGSAWRPRTLGRPPGRSARPPPTRAVQGDVGLAVGAHATIVVRSAASARSSAARKPVEVLGALVAEPVERGGVREVEPVRGGDVLLEVRRPRALTGRKWKIPPPSLSSSTIVSLTPSRVARQQPADVVGQRDVADQQHDRPVAPRRRRRTRSRRCRRCRWRRGWRARAAGRRGRRRTSRRRAPASRRRRRACRARAAAHAELGGDARLAEAVGPSARPIAPRGGAVGVPPAVEPRAVAARRRALAERAASAQRGSAPRMVADAPRGPARRPRGRRRPAARRRGRAATGAAAWRSAGRRRG